MEKLREMVIQMATADQKKPLLSSQVAQIEQQLHTSFPAGLHTPHHPSYPAMIYKAITELNEEGGSTEESISQYIQAEYKDLPFAHKSFLSQHLRKLSGKGFVVFTAAKCYMIATFTRAPAGKRTPSIKRKHGVNRVTPPPREYRVSVDNCFQSDESKGNNGRKRRMPRRRQLVFDDEEELCNATSMKLSLAREIRRLDNKGRRRSESRTLLPETTKQKKLILNKSGDETGTNVLLQELDTDGVHSTVGQSKGESSKVLVKRKKKDMIKWMVKALSDRPPEKLPDEAEMRQCLTMPETTMDTSTNNGNQITNHEERKYPSFIQPLVHTSFFDKCEVHLDADSNNFHSYCFDCMNALCTSCRASHQDHNVIRIYRTMWENSVSASKIQMYLDISGIQTHHIKPNMDFVSLKRTVQSRHRKHFSGACVICKRCLPESFKFCSLNCKIEHDLASYMPSATN